MKLFSSIKLLPFTDFRRDKYFIWLTRINLLIFLVCSLVLIFFFRKLPPVIPFYYSLTWGEEQLAPPIALILLFSVVLILALINTILSLLIFKRNIYLAHLLLINSSGIIFLSGVTIIKIILLVT